MLKVLVLGSTGGIGKAACSLLLDQGYEVVPLQRNDIKNIQEILSRENPDWIFNCIGYLGNNQSSYSEVFDPNIGINWTIIKFYLENFDYAVKVVMLGSTAHEFGRKNYILYSASKAALHNMWQGACENFEGTKIRLGLIHPGSVDTPMIAHLNKNITLSPQEVAASMIKLASLMTNNSSLLYLRS